MISRLSILWKLTIAVGLAVFSYFVWPTPYRYDHVKFGNMYTLVRTNRLTGNSDTLYGSKWLRVRAAEGPVEDMTSAQIGKLKGEASIDGQGRLKVSLYNGTSFKLTEITVEVTICQGKDSGVVLDRLFRMTPDLGGGGPFEMANFEADSGYQPDFNDPGLATVLTNPTFQHNGPPGFDLGLGPDRWQIKSAKGIRIR